MQLTQEASMDRSDSMQSNSLQWADGCQRHLPLGSGQSEGQGSTAYAHYSEIWTQSHDLSVRSSHLTIKLPCLICSIGTALLSNVSVFDIFYCLPAQAVMEENQAGKAKLMRRTGGGHRAWCSIAFPGDKRGPHKTRSHIPDGTSITQPEYQKAAFLGDGCLICQSQGPKLVIIRLKPSLITDWWENKYPYKNGTISNTSCGCLGLKKSEKIEAWCTAGITLIDIQGEEKNAAEQCAELDSVSWKTFK